MLLMNVVYFLAVHAKLVPREINAFGITAGVFRPEAVLFVLNMALLYFIAAFSMYAAADHAAWRAEMEQSKDAWEASFVAIFDRVLKRNLEPSVKDGLRQGGLIPTDALIDEVISKLQLSQLNDTRTATKEEAWKIYSHDYRRRAAFEIRVPFAITVVNLVLGLAAQYVGWALF